MSVGFKIKKLREEKKLSQPELANELNISQAKLSNIENGQTKTIDFILMDKVCKIFDKDFDYFTSAENQVNHVDKNDGNVGVIGYNHGTINLFPENIIEEIKKLVDDNAKKEELIKALREENKMLRDKKQ